MYRRGELGTKAQLQRRTGARVPFLDDSGRIIPYEKMTERQALNMDSFVLTVTGTSSRILLAVDDAVDRANASARTKC